MDMTPGIQQGLGISTWGQAPNRGKSLSAGWRLVTKNLPFSHILSLLNIPPAALTFSLSNPF